MTPMNRLCRVRMLALPMLLVTTVVFADAASQEKATQEAKETARKSGNAVKDSWITLKVHSQFVPENALEGSDIDVETKAGVVTLTGTVPSDAGRARAIAIAKATDGVVNVTDRLRIAAPDADVASAREAGRRTGAETREAGREAKEEAREAGRTARDAAKETTGTAGRAVTDGWIKSKIASQFVTEDTLDDGDIDIDVARGVVTLTGAVRNAAGRNRAEAIAKATDGVKSVNNKLKVDPSIQ